MFRGECTITVDAKGRVAVPSRYRERLAELCGGKLVLTVSLLWRCLTVYPFPHWQKIEDELRSLPALDQKAQSISHLLIGHACECDMDSHGRVLIPPSLREFAGLERRVTLVGQVHKIELWDESVWNARREELHAHMPELLAKPSDVLRGLVL